MIGCITIVLVAVVMLSLDAVRSISTTPARGVQSIDRWQWRAIAATWVDLRMVGW